MQKAKGEGKDLTKLDRKYQKYHTQYEDLNIKAVGLTEYSAMDKCIGAFVTFEYSESADRCIEDYRCSETMGIGFGFWGWWCRINQPNELKFKAKDGKRYSLKVGQAPEPSNINWEHVECTDLERLFRVICTTLAVGVLVSTCFAIIYIIMIVKLKISASMPGTECDQRIPGLFQQNS